ncbi:hypothetical protein SAMN02745146_0782 [Hymenobacter daecheongensis DSM 21074]|uniref:Uncharacterized protein n=1 Tax=Hymenobacter daecheongensis DSM 21074 TaxID=1121955 RepID=A0A1M6AVE6_9BACT|nr:hypothetical protein [Hymenobacter daecheongensis]SHI40519.1 hypothetical protein SAMN02745146_0782 [Hymenobacter daecheongensis DSM 21074]
MHSCWLAAPLLLLTAACGWNDAPRPEQPARKPLYFDVKGLLDAQVTALTKQNPAVEKKVQLRGGPPETTRVPHANWSKELQIFYQADINKAALRGAYTTMPPTRTPAGVRQVYVRKPGIASAVEQLAVLSDGPDVREVAATLTQDNPLFFSRKKLVLSYQSGTLSSYRVEGIQKLVLFDTLRYAAAVRVL